MVDAVAGLVLAAGSSRRLGQPKQLLPFAGRTLLDASLDVARSAPFSQRLVTVGGSADAVRRDVDFDGFTVVDSLHYTDGCSSSIVSALQTIEADASGLVLMLGDQPGVSVAAITGLISTARAQAAPIAVCRYRDGIGHPFWFGRETFVDLQDLHGDKGVWKLIESGRYPVVEVDVDTTIPPDVDTWDDYQALLAANEQREGSR